MISCPEPSLPLINLSKARGALTTDLQNVRLQNLRDFTVQIRHARTNKIVGTGIVVTTDGKIVTCAHVAAEAGASARSKGRIPKSWEKIITGILARIHRFLSAAKDTEVGVYFPQVQASKDRMRRAKLLSSFPRHDDDVVLLQLTGGPTPLRPEQIAVLGGADLSEGHEFRSYGYVPLGEYPAGRAVGRILGDVEAPARRLLQADPVELECQQIDHGISGAAVLDVEINLVVGIIFQTYYATQTAKSRDSAWAVNARVLGLDPLRLTLRQKPLDKRAGPQPPADTGEVRAAVLANSGNAWNNAPALLPGWAGREDLLRAITADWADAAHHVTGLIGFGGEGKSSLARRWVHDLLNDESKRQPDGVFWWGFYERPSVDEFFESALAYISGGHVDPRRYPSSRAKAHLIAAILYTGGFLFILDGLEVLQHQGGDQYGLFTSNDLREFLTYFAALGHQSFCLVTSRAPLLDLMEYEGTAYAHRDVERLSPTDGRVLLRGVGVRGPDEALDKLVAAWDGHALTLSLLGGYVVERYNGNVAQMDDIPVPTIGEPRHERVHRVLRRYAEHLTDAERAFMMIFSAFRIPVAEAAFERVFRANRDKKALNAPIAALDGTAFNAMVKRLLDYRILRYDPRAHHYTVHPLIRAHYTERLASVEVARVLAEHERIKDYYLAIATDTPGSPTLRDLQLLIEAVHHACQAGTYDQADRILYDRLIRPDRLLLNQLGAYETALAILLEFFLGADTSLEPQVSNLSDKGVILNEIGLCLMNLGRLSEALPFYLRTLAVLRAMRGWTEASRVRVNLAELRAHLGLLAASIDEARVAVALARKGASNFEECQALAQLAWASHLLGDLGVARETFERAQALEREANAAIQYLYGNRGIMHADHLQRAGDRAYARRITEANLRVCKIGNWLKVISQCHRVLGDLDAYAEHDHSAQQHYHEALMMAQNISFRPALIEVLIARGRWAARHDGKLARSDLDQALDLAVRGGYRIYEMDARIGLAWAHLVAGDRSTAQGEAKCVKQLSAEMGYHWGQLDAAQILAKLN